MTNPLDQKAVLLIAAFCMTEKAAHFAVENEKIHFIEFISSTQAVLLGDWSLLSKALDVSPPSSSSPFDQTCYCCNYLHEQDMKPSSFEFILWTTAKIMGRLLFSTTTTPKLFIVGCT